MIYGSCLCGGIQFEIHGDVPGIGQCHCSLCRKVSGVGSTATINIAVEQLVWRSGQDLVTEFQRASGYGTSFCRVCGSPAPDANRTRTRYGVPIGLLAEVPTTIAEHTYVASKASWDVIGDDAPQYAQAGPPLPEGQLALSAPPRTVHEGRSRRARPPPEADPAHNAGVRALQRPRRRAGGRACASSRSHPRHPGGRGGWLAMTVQMA